MNESTQHRTLLLFLWSAAIVINSITFLIIYYKIRPGETPLALHYNVIIGVDVFSKGTDIYKIPGLGFVFLVINGLLAQIIKPWQAVFQLFIAAASLLITLTLFLAILLLLTVN